MAIIYYANQDVKGSITTGGTITSGGIVSAPGGNSTQWNTSYDNMITGLAVTGTTTKTNTDVTFTVEAPNGNLVSVDQIAPGSSGDFAIDITVGGPLWSQDGAYTVTAQQGSGSSFTDSVEV